MWKIADQIKQALEKLGIDATQLSPSDANVIRDTVAVRFADGGSADARPLWERLQSAVSVRSEDGRKWISDYVGQRKSVLFFEKRDEPWAFEFLRGNAIADVIGECSGFEFYVTNPEATFVLCFNHHDYLIAAGDAVAWLLSRRSS